MSSEFVCSYHPTRSAVDKCENCSTYICLECKKILPESTSRGNTSLFDNRYQRAGHFSPKTVLCPLCYFKAEEQLQRTSNRANFWFPLIFITIFLGFFLFILTILFIFIGESQSFTIIFWIFVPIFILIPLLFFGIFFFTNWFSKPRKINHIQKEREIFQQSINLKSIPGNPDFQSTESFCLTCGAIIEFNERFCPKCGSSTQRF